ncbi:MAG: RNA 2',3'-cyclic phosphodiesterase [Acidobacteriota bacterium]
MKRIFFAVDISDDVKAVAAERISRFRKEFPDVRVSWAKPENLHITLKFVGDAEDEQIESLSSHLAAAFEKIPQFRIGLSTPSAFGKRVLSITVDEDTDSLPAINEILESACERVSVPREKRAFKPHLTLARIRDERGIDALISEHAKIQIEPVEWEVREIALYESELHPTGSVYSKLKTFPLGTDRFSDTTD